MSYKAAILDSVEEYNNEVSKIKSTKLFYNENTTLDMISTRESIAATESSYGDKPVKGYSKTYENKPVGSSSRFVILKADEGNNYYVSFKGTSTSYEALKDLQISRATFTYGESGNSWVHSGFLDVYNDLRESLIKELSSLPRGANVKFVGHSLGGALAMLASADKGLPIVPSKVITYGAPTVGSWGFNSDLLGRSPNVTNIVNGGDTVTRVAPGIPPVAPININPRKGGIMDVLRNYEDIPQALKSGYDNVKDHSLSTYNESLDEIEKGNIEPEIVNSESERQLTNHAYWLHKVTMGFDPDTNDGISNGSISKSMIVSWLRKTAVNLKNELNLIIKVDRISNIIYDNFGIKAERGSSSMNDVWNYIKDSKDVRRYTKYGGTTKGITARILGTEELGLSKLNKLLEPFDELVVASGYVLRSGVVAIEASGATALFAASSAAYASVYVPLRTFELSAQTYVKASKALNTGINQILEISSQVFEGVHLTQPPKLDWTNDSIYNSYPETKAGKIAKLDHIRSKQANFNAKMEEYLDLQAIYNNRYASVTSKVSKYLDIKTAPIRGTNLYLKTSNVYNVSKNFMKDSKIYNAAERGAIEISNTIRASAKAIPKAAEIAGAVAKVPVAVLGAGIKMGTAISTAIAPYKSAISKANSLLMAISVGVELYNSISERYTMDELSVSTQDLIIKLKSNLEDMAVYYKNGEITLEEFISVDSYVNSELSNLREKLVMLSSYYWPKGMTFFGASLADYYRQTHPGESEDEIKADVLNIEKEQELLAAAGFLIPGIPESVDLEGLTTEQLIQIIMSYNKKTTPTYDEVIKEVERYKNNYTIAPSQDPQNPYPVIIRKIKREENMPWLNMNAMNVMNGSKKRKHS